MIAPKVREVLVQILFALDTGGDEEVIPLVMREAKLTKARVRDAYGVAVAVRKNAAAYDRRIAIATKEYELERIPTVEKNIIRYALYEIDQGCDIPLVVKEAVRLARKFSTPEAGAFVHAVLQTLTTVPPQEGSDIS